MSEYRKTFAGNLYFVSLTVSGWIDVFTRTEYREENIRNLQHCQQKEGLEIFAYVLMPNHLHLVCRRNSDKTLTELLGRFKSYTSKRLLKLIEEHPQESRKDWLLYLFRYFAKQNTQYSTYHFWQAENYPVELTTPATIQQKVDYILQNPVRAGFVTEPQYYPYSSACPDSRLKVLDL